MLFLFTADLVIRQKIVVSHKDFHKLKTAKFDLFRTCYHAGFPVWGQTASEYNRLPGGFFCLFLGKQVDYQPPRWPERRQWQPYIAEYP